MLVYYRHVKLYPTEPTNMNGRESWPRLFFVLNPSNLLQIINNLISVIDCYFNTSYVKV